MINVERILPATGTEDKNMQNENRNDEAVSPVIATILMVAITVVLAGVLYVWAASLAEGNTGNDLTMYTFSGDDAFGTVTDGMDDNLIRVTMMQGSDLNWASILVKISIDIGDGNGTSAPITCSNPSDSTGNCELVEFGDTTDQFWSVGDGVTIKESGMDICSSGTSCLVTVTIVDTREGKTLDNSEAIAE